MARDGSRGFERVNSWIEHKAIRDRQSRLDAMKRETQAVFDNARRADLLPVVPIQSFDGGSGIMDIIASLYDVARVSRVVATSFANNGDELPRLICRKTGTVIGFCSPSQWDAMQAIWPDISLEQAEAMLAVTGAIAPHAIFSHPQALQVLAGIDPIGAAILALDTAIHANWSGTEKQAIRADLQASLMGDEGEELDEGETDDTLTLAILELSQDLLRFNAGWHSERSLQSHVKAIHDNVRDAASLIEALKDACHAVAKFVIGSIGIRELIEQTKARVILLCEKHGAAYVRRTAPLLGEAEIARRIIGSYYRDFTHVFARMTDADLLLIVGNAYQFEQRAFNAQLRGNRNMPAQILKRLNEYRRDEAENTLEGLIASVDQFDLGENEGESGNNAVDEKPLSGIALLKAKRAEKAAKTAETATNENGGTDEQDHD